MVLSVETAVCCAQVRIRWRNGPSSPDGNRSVACRGMCGRMLNANLGPVLARMAAVLVAATLVFGCGRLKPPTLTPRSVAVTRVSPSGMRVQVEVDAHNPNRVDLVVQAVSATLTLEGGVALGNASVTTKTKLPAQETTRVTAQLDLPWKSLADAASLAQGKDRIPYTLRGTARVGGALTIDVPFTIQGEVTAAQIVQATLRALPQLPGLGIP